MKNIKNLIAQFNQEQPMEKEVLVATKGIPSRRERREQAKKNDVAFQPQYNYLAPLTIAEQRERTNKLMSWLSKKGTQIANA